MGLGDVIGEEESNDEQERGNNNTTAQGEDPQEVVKRIRDRLFLNEFCEDIGDIVEPPEQKEFVSRGSKELDEPLPEGYVDCTDEVEFIPPETKKWMDNSIKYISCPHCPESNLRQRKGKAVGKGESWGRCGGCSRILVDLEAGNRDSEGNIIEQQSISSWM